MPVHRKKKQSTPYHVRFFLTLFILLVVFVFALYAQFNSSTTYAGILPCADCSGIKTTLTLNSNHTFAIQSLYIGRNTLFTEKGVWQQEEKNNMQVYQLKSSTLTSYYQIIDESTLKMLDTNAKPIDAPFNLQLKKQ